ncbi:MULTISPECIES: hypothetical protein [unclassified Meridianimarinicoccus]|uniref:hypothetical protein n=1 Tax=unclassified Meridianimarinicoccus TaxID=2923344 RepID=UPI00186764B9|nr:hypothetical protein [Fluviibacterium sp. MJW13]
MRCLRVGVQGGIVALLLALSPAGAATRVDAIHVVFQDFSYQSNFWAGVMPTATVGGPAPITRMDMGFHLTYRTPVDQAFAFGLRQPAVTGVSVSMQTADIAGLSMSGMRISHSVMTDALVIQSGAGFGLRGGVEVFTAASGATTPLARLSFTLPGLFNLDPLTGAEIASYDYNSPRPLDAPRYGAQAMSGAAIQVQRRFVSSTPGPVPLSGALVYGISGLVALTGVGLRGRGRLRCRDAGRRKLLRGRRTVFGARVFPSSSRGGRPR